MKKIFSLFMLTSVTVIAQQSSFNDLIEAERRSAASRRNFTANLNTGNYDMTHVTLEFTVNPAFQFITGTITTVYTAKENMQTITFDLDNQLTVNSVTQNGNALPFTQNFNDELVITLPGTQIQGTEASVTVNYSGAPTQANGSFVASQHSGVPLLWTLSEPYGAKEWWPCKQDLNDKIDNIDVYITAPTEYVSVSNGVVQTHVVNGNGTTTTHFTHSYPIPAYLIAIAVTNYAIYEQEAGTAPDTFPIVNYIYPESLPGVTPLLQQTPPIMDFFEETFEQYPFSGEKYGHAQCGFGGGMEHTTVSFMGSFNRDLIAHELAHQWFGDKITCGSWQDIWLNEGFATYLTGLTIGHMDGDNSFRTWRYERIANITSDPGGSVYIPESDTLSVSRVFSGRLTYNKGAMVLHMLRLKLGNENFYQGVNNYLADENLAFAYAKTPDLIAHMEAASGTDLQEFFNDWVYHEGYPIYNAVIQNAGFGNALVTINQQQSHPSVSFFEMNVPVRFLGPDNQVFDTVLDNTFNGQQFTVAVPFEFEDVMLNYDYDIISAGGTVTLGTDSALLNALKLYPNPVTDVMHLDVPEGVAVKKVVVINNIGQVVSELDCSDCNVSGLASGLYTAEIVTDKGRKQFKFIKK